MFCQDCNQVLAEKVPLNLNRIMPASGHLHHTHGRLLNRPHVSAALSAV
ncbi:hypothetical protein C5167_003558 [Papaver somniferum]|uniref:Uncharacterized protein n=1 Tax=Papaver somniferum TaxID=3469 RepID=A0A4Y7L2D2_PAPSO|nr:hypothetical protein C5167_003558 [Papaver somniferum]